MASTSQPHLNEAQLERHLRREVHAALLRGSAISAVLGLLNGVLLLPLVLLGLVQGLEIPCAYAFVAAALSLALYACARRGQMTERQIAALFLPFVLFPTAFFVTCQLLRPDGASSYITGPFSFLYFVVILVSGFLFDARFSIAAGVLSGAGYFAVYLMARSRLQGIPLADPALAQDLASPLIFALKSVMIAFGGVLVAALSIIARRLIRRVLNEEHEKAFITSTFGMIVDPRVRDRMIQGEIELGGETRVNTVLFADIRGFTTFSQHLAPRDLLLFMKEYFDLMNEEIQAEEGTIMEYVGDEIMVLFGAPLPLADHARRAGCAALRMQEALICERAAWEHAGKPVVRAGIGIHTGPMLVGNIGSSERYKYGAIGDNVNVASRVQGLTKEYGVGILATEDAIQAAAGAFHVRELDRVQVRGRDTAVTVYEILGLADRPLPEAKRALLDAWEAAQDRLRVGDREGARAGFARCAALAPQDGPTRRILAQLEPALEMVS